MAAAVRKTGRSYQFYRYLCKCEKIIIALSVFIFKDMSFIHNDLVPHTRKRGSQKHCNLVVVYKI